LALAPLLLLGQEAGRVEFTCTEKDVHDFGLICSEDEPCPVFLELASVESAGAAVILTGNLHTVSTTLYSILLSSEDGGKTWTEPHRRIAWAALDQIQFADFQHGWIAAVKLEPLPRDPFLLVTTDGGRTWRERPLFEETRFGMIQQFWFDSSTSGELIVDRSQGSTRSYELYETFTGGDSWTVKELTKDPPKLTRARPRTAQPTWRIRTDAATRTYKVERRTASAWETLASFAVQAGQCQ
jgi:photosystem II stability/assembly factor-like uncharacterized protein